MNNEQRTRFIQRVKERYIWMIAGRILGAIGMGMFIITIIIGFLIGNLIPLSFFDLNYKMIGISILIFFYGVFFSFLGEMGWSKSRILDFLLNRLSSLFIVLGMIAQSLAPPFVTIWPEGVFYGSVMVAIGLVLFFLGLYLSNTKEAVDTISKDG